MCTRVVNIGERVTAILFKRTTEVHVFVAKDLQKYPAAAVSLSNNHRTEVRGVAYTVTYTCNIM